MRNYDGEVDNSIPLRATAEVENAHERVTDRAYKFGIKKIAINKYSEVLTACLRMVEDMVGRDERVTVTVTRILASVGLGLAAASAVREPTPCAGAASLSLERI